MKERKIIRRIEEAPQALREVYNDFRRRYPQGEIASMELSTEGFNNELSLQMGNGKRNVLGVFAYDGEEIRHYTHKRFGKEGREVSSIMVILDGR